MQTTCGCGAATGDEAFIRTLDAETRHIIEDPEGAPELINTGEEVFAQYDRHELTEWTRLKFGKDPVIEKNIMYKGHLNLVYGLYRLISGSYEFDEEYPPQRYDCAREPQQRAQPQFLGHRVRARSVVHALQRHRHALRGRI